MTLSMKAIKRDHKYIFAAPFCSLSSLLADEPKVGMTFGTNGKNADVYFFGEVVLTTGYRAFGQKIPGDVLEKFESRAKKLRERTDLSWTEVRDGCHLAAKVMLSQLVNDQNQTAIY